MGSDSFNKTSLGRIGVFLLPSLKMKSHSSPGRTYDQDLHDFLLKHFDGYTVTTGNISGYWKDPRGNEHYGEHREYKIGYTDESKLPALEQYIATLAAEIDEEAVYCEIGERAFLLHPKAAGNPKT